MKVCFYIDTLMRGGAQRVMTNLIEYFYLKEEDVILINDYKVSNMMPQYSINKNIRKYYITPENKKNPIAKNVLRMYNLRRILFREKPDVIVSFLGRINITTLLSSVGLPVKKIVSVRNDPEKEYGKKLIIKTFVNLVFLRANGIVFQTDDQKNYFNKHIKNKSVKIYNPINEDFFNSEYNRQNSDIVTFGRLEEQKNHYLLIDSFLHLNKKNVKLYIYGEGPLRESLEKYVSKINAQNRIFFPGNITNVKKILETSSIFVLPSNYEGLPNALMEAMAVGIPCIATDCPCGGPKELIHSGINGILVKCNDLENLVDAMNEILNNPDYAKILSSNAKLSSERFRPEKILKQWYEYISAIANSC